MSNGAQHASPDSRFGVWIGATVVLFLAAVMVGFVWLPSAQSGAGAVGLWDVICRAVGLPGSSGSQPAPLTRQPSSTVAWTPATRALLTRGDPTRGATLAAACNNCHGANGISADAAIPNLAGHSVAAIYKQLEDFKSNRRNAAVMGVFVGALSQQQMLDLAAHYAALPNPLSDAGASSNATDAAAKALAEVGAPLRGIAPCAACHGPQGLTTGAPALRGQQRAYLEQQLLAFKADRRHNDISVQMRSVARQLNDEEIAKLAAYYSSFVK
ncbi:MAG TPA: c-type cytochrome [Burkholderiaceae bacterium]|jgi:cytochrome c553